MSENRAESEIFTGVYVGWVFMGAECAQSGGAGTLNLGWGCGLAMTDIKYPSY